MKTRTLPAILVLGLLKLVLAGSLPRALAQTQAVPIAILNFLDDTGDNVPADVGQKLAHDLHQAVAIRYRDLLPRLVAGAPPSAAGLPPDQVAALAKQNEAKYIVRGGLLALTSEPAGSDSKVTAQLYADIISADNAAIIASVRAEGSGTQSGSVPQPAALDVKGAQFSSSGVGQALAGAIAQLADAIHQAVTGQAANSSATNSNSQTIPVNQPEASQAGAQDAAADQELQQLIAQGQAILDANPNSSTQNVNALQQALGALKSSLATKASLLQESKDTTAADQDIAARKQDLQTALASLTAEASAPNASVAANGSTAGDSLGQNQQPTGQKKDLLARVGDFAEEAIGLLQKIQELRATLRSVHEDQSAAAAPAQDPTSPQPSPTQSNPPTEAPAGEVSGVVTSDRSPVDGAVVTNQETGESTTTDATGSFSLKGLITGRLSQIVVTKNAQMICRGQVDIPKGRAAIADCQTKTPLGGRTPAVALPGILPSTVVASPAGHPGVGAGALEGEVKDSTGRPASFALVQLPGVGVARTNAQGQYAFLNVPAGAYRLTVRQSGKIPKSSQVVVAPGASVALQTQFTPADAIAGSSHTLLLAGAGTVLRGTVLDDHTRPVTGARISVIQSQATVTVLTTAGGAYELRNLKPGTYRVSAYKVGYQVVGQTVLVTAAAPEERDFHLSPVASPSVNSLISSAVARQGEVRGIPRTQAGAPIPNSGVASTPRLPETRKGEPPPAPKGRVAGRVTDAKTGAPLAGVTVSIAGHGTATSGTDGSYSFVNLALGIYQITAKKPGFAESQKSVTVRGADTVPANFALSSTSANRAR